MNQIFHHQSRVATDSTSLDYPVCTRDTSAAFWMPNNHEQV